MGDDTQLGHTSSLQSGQRVPDGKRYHGSPAIETTSDYCPIEGMKIGAFRAAFFSALELAALCLIAVPLPIVAVRQDRVLATSFHPELTGDTRVHSYFVEMVRESRA